MPVRIVCSACNTVMQVADELLGKRVRCKSCGGVVPVALSAGYEIAETRRAPTAPSMPPRRRVVDDDDDDRASPRRRRTGAQASLMPLWIAGGGVLAVALIVVLVVLLRSGSTPVPVANANEAQPVAQNQQPAAQPMNAVPERKNAPALIADVPVGQTMKGEQIYQRLLQSTVWIVAEHKIVAANNNRPFAQVFDPPPFPQPKIPRGPILGPNFPRGPQFGPPNMPGLNPGQPFLPQAGQTSNLTGSTWLGSETLPGFGKLRFQFVSNISVIMVDAKETSKGSFAHTGNNVTITFGGGVIYNGVVNGNTMGGNATNGQTNWTWNVSRSGTGGGGGGAPPVNNPGGGIVAKSTGSGSVIDRKHRLVVTNVHVVGNGNQVTVYFPDFDDKGELIVHSDAYKRKPGYTGRVVMKEERADLALVQLDKLPEGVQPLSLVKSKAKPAQQVHSVGNPGATKGLWIYSPGKIRQVFQDKWEITDDLDGRTHRYDAMKIETDSPINPGDSGGPLVDDRCALVGVAHGGSVVANNFSFFIETSEVRQLLDKYYRSVGDNFTQ